jgi:hypothetical protein
MFTATAAKYENSHVDKLAVQVDVSLVMLKGYCFPDSSVKPLLHRLATGRLGAQVSTASGLTVIDTFV